MPKIEFIYESDVKANAIAGGASGSAGKAYGCITEDDVTRALPKISQPDKAPSGPSGGKAEPQGMAAQNKPADSPTKATAIKKG